MLRKGADLIEKKDKYKGLTDTEFDAILEELLGECSPSALLSIPGLYEIVREHFNNDILETWERRMGVDGEGDDE